MKRRRPSVHRHRPRHDKGGIRRHGSSLPPRRYLLVALIFMLQQEDACVVALISSASRTATPPNSATGSRSGSGGGWGTLDSPLFCGTARRLNLERQRRQRQRQWQSSSTALSMVLTTPESIIEQASTVNLLDDLIDESVRTSPRRPIMMQFDPSSGWIWRRWKGTIFSESWTTCVRNMVYACIIFLLYKRFPQIKEHLNGFGTLWGHLLSVTTFTLTFFVNQSYALWRKCYELSRRLQGRLHDIGMNLATHAARKVPTSPHETSTYTASSRQILELMSRYIRLFDLLTYASFTRSHRPILTPRGMRRLVERGLMTPQEREVLVDAAIPATQRHSAILMWMVRLFVEGRASGHILGGDGFEQQTMEKFHVIRAQYGAIGDELQGRMPLAYAHVVQILVDVILWMYPVMAFSIGMSPVVAIAGTGLLTFSYQGLFDLAKQFLDPYDNENYGKGEDPLSVDTLIAETNAGSVRWMYGFEEMPFSQQKLQDGELYDYLLPVRGYSLEELAQMEEEKLKREKEMEEQRIREEEERLQREAEEEAQAAEQGDDGSKEEKAETLDDELPVDGNQTNGEDPGQSSEAVEEHEEAPVAVDRQVHKIFTLANGTVVSFKEEPEILGKAPVPDPAVPEGSGPYLASLTREGGLVSTPVAETTLSEEEEAPESDLVDDDKIEELQFFDSVAPDGEDPHLTQSPVEEDMDDDNDDVEALTMSQEDFEKKIEEAKESARIELLQAMESRNAQQASKEKIATMSGPASSQLAEENVNMTQQATNLEEEQGPQAGADDDGGSVSSELPEEKMVGTSESPSTSANDNAVVDKPQTNEATGENVTENESAAARQQDENKESTKPLRLTLDDYNKQVVKIMEAAKEEMLETEAILNARPGADPLGWDYDDEQLAPSTDGSEVVAEDKEEVAEVEPEQEYDLEVLEMDTSDYKEAPEATDLDEAEELVDSANVTDTTSVDEGTEDVATEDPDDAIVAEEEEDNIDVEDAPANSTESVESMYKGSDKIEPIFIHEDDEDVEADPSEDAASDTTTEDSKVDHDSEK